jgi:hypothetical protein
MKRTLVGLLVALPLFITAMQKQASALVIDKSHCCIALKREPL